MAASVAHPQVVPGVPQASGLLLVSWPRGVGPADCLVNRHPPFLQALGSPRPRPRLRQHSPYPRASARLASLGLGPQSQGRRRPEATEGPLRPGVPEEMTEEAP